MSVMYRPRTSAPVRSRDSGLRLGFVAVSALLLGAAGCTVHTDDSPPPAAPPPPRVVHEYRTVPAPAPAPTVVYVYGHRADPVNAPPAGWRTSPRVAYRGSDAYWIGGRWYYRTYDRGWVVLRDEPRELGTWRAQAYAPQRVHGYLVDRTNRPADVNRYPRVPYRGSYAYLIGGRWYFKTDAGLWIVFREEPRELERRRIEMRRGPEYAYPRY